MPYQSKGVIMITYNNAFINKTASKLSELKSRIEHPSVNDILFEVYLPSVVNYFAQHRLFLLSILFNKQTLVCLITSKISLTTVKKQHILLNAVYSICNAKRNNTLLVYILNISIKEKIDTMGCVFFEKLSSTLIQ